MKMTLSIVFGIMFTAVHICQAQSIQYLHHQNAVQSTTFIPFSASNTFTQPERESTIANTAKTKSPFKAAILSGILPGAGQWYAGNKKRALAFFAAEASLWFGHDRYNGKGDDKKKEFRTYADKYWSRTEYEIWLTTDPNADLYSTHTLPSTNTQQYYEMIGKYDQFLAGWHDSDNETIESPMRLLYMDMQHTSNTFYKRAEWMAKLLVLNRVVSAAEAALSLRTKNQNISMNVSMRYNTYSLHSIPTVNIRYEW